MALSHSFGTFAVKEAKLSQMLADPPGGTATYAASIAAPGIREVKLTAKIKAESLYGDMQILSAFAVVEGLDIQFMNAELGLDEVAVLMGGTVVDAGTTPSQTSTMHLPGNTQPNYFKFEARCTAIDNPGSDVHMILPKCIVSALDLGFALEAFHINTFGAMCVPPRATGDLFTLIENETAVAIA